MHAVTPARKSALLAAVLCGLASGVAAHAQAPVIRDAEHPCVARLPYPILDAAIEPGDRVGAARLYFRAAQGSDFYAVDMRPAAARFEGILPVPGPETAQVVYYVEALGTNGDGSSRTAEMTAEVVPEDDGCANRVFAGTEPGIVVYATSDAAAALPTGFLPAGVTTTVASNGVATAVASGVGVAGGGLSKAAILALAAGGVAASALIIEENESEVRSPTDP